MNLPNKQQLLTAAAVIRAEEGAGKNTAERIGKMFVDIINAVSNATEAIAAAADLNALKSVVERIIDNESTDEIDSIYGLQRFLQGYSEADTLSAIIAAAKYDAREELFKDLWKEAVEAYGGYDASHPEAPYTLVGLNLTYAEALKVYNAGAIRNNADNLYRGHNIRVNLPNKGHSSFMLSFTFYGCAELETAFVFTGIANNSAFYSCPKLRQVGTPSRKLYTINGDNTKKAFLLCPALEVVYGTIRGTYGIDVRDSPLLTLDNFKAWISTAANTAPISIIVHPVIYAKLAAGDSEWQALITQAADKDITFTTV